MFSSSCYFFPLVYIFYYLINVDKGDFLHNLFLILAFICLYPLFLGHNIPYGNYRFV